LLIPIMSTITTIKAANAISSQIQQYIISLLKELNVLVLI